MTPNHQEKKMSFSITKEWLKEKNACKDGYEWSLKVFAAGEAVPVAKFVRALVDDDKDDWANWILERVFTKEQSVAYAIYAAELVIENYEKKYPGDDRPRKAIETARAVLKHDTEETRSAAKSASRSAWSAKSAAESAARSAAECAECAAECAAEFAAECAWSAAESAARSAARSVRSATDSDEFAAVCAESAARSAAWSVAESAWSATWFATMKKILEYGIMLLTNSQTRQMATTQNTIKTASRRYER